MKFNNITNEIIQGLPTGTILKLKKSYSSEGKETPLCMVLRGVMNRTHYENIVSGETWRPLCSIKLEDVKGIYQPTSNVYYLSNGQGNSGITTVGTETLWEFKEKTERELKLEKLHKQAQDIADQIAELD
jgi:hypothetical protein